MNTNTNSAAEQQEVRQAGAAMFAVVSGQPLETIPEDLYIPPDALRVFLEKFEGPLDLLLYLIKRQNLDILELPVALITEQYMQYIDMMQELQLDLAAEYLAMAATLAEIKSRMLLPRKPEEDKEEEDPRADLVRRLVEYQRFKMAVEEIDLMSRCERDFVVVSADNSNLSIATPDPEIALDDVLVAFQEVLKNADLRRSHRVFREPLSARERMSIILSLLAKNDRVSFADCFTAEEGRSGVVITFISLLELMRSGMIKIIQAQSYGPVYLSRMEPLAL